MMKKQMLTLALAGLFFSAGASDDNQQTAPQQPDYTTTTLKAFILGMQTFVYTENYKTVIRHVIIGGWKCNFSLFHLRWFLSLVTAGAALKIVYDSMDEDVKKSNYALWLRRLALVVPFCYSITTFPSYIRTIPRW